MFDDRESFGVHITHVSKKAEARATTLTRIMPNIKGPMTRKREYLNGAVQSILLYGAPIWHQAMRVRAYKNCIEKVQRLMLLRIGSAYRTVSTKAMQVITGIPPIHLLAEERWRIHERIKVNTLNLWQNAWREETEVEAWTRRLIPEIGGWIKCRHHYVNYYVTEALSGHGSFRAYTKQIGKTIDDRCVYCVEEDTPEHTIFICIRWEIIRNAAYGQLGRELNA